MVGRTFRVEPRLLLRGCLFRRLVRLAVVGHPDGVGRRHFAWILNTGELRRERDSNPRYLLGTHAFQACTFDHSDISPKKTRQTAGAKVSPATEREGFGFRLADHPLASSPPSSPAGALLAPFPRYRSAETPVRIPIFAVRGGLYRQSVASYGERGIRTLGSLTRSTVFETARFNRSRISPVFPASASIPVTVGSGTAPRPGCRYKQSRRDVPSAPCMRLRGFEPPTFRSAI